MICLYFGRQDLLVDSRYPEKYPGIGGDNSFCSDKRRD